MSTPNQALGHELSVSRRIAQELAVRESQVQAAIRLLEEGATVPFIARYRKEATDGLDDTQLRNLAERLLYLQELDKRRDAIIKSIHEQGKMSDALMADLMSADAKSRLEDLYLPYKPKRRNKAQIAREAGLEPLAKSLLTNPSLSPEQEAAKYLNPELAVTTVQEALEGAGQILIEQFSEVPELLGTLREALWNRGKVVSKVTKGKKEEAAKFTDYFEYEEAIRSIPSHRALALFRGQSEGMLKLSLQPAFRDDEIESAHQSHEGRIAKTFQIRAGGRPADAWLLGLVSKAWRDKISSHLESELMARLREQAEEEAIRVFARNLHDLLLAPPAGPKVTLGLDPGLRTGVKTVVVDSTGKLLDTKVIYPHVPMNQWENSLETLGGLCKKHHVSIISIGNGTASRETDKLAAELIKRHPELKMQKIVVSEAGASVYSASELASKEFPDLDVSYRGAVSIARRLQDPLAELVKIDPKSIGVGQYQHDVNQGQLGRALDAVVEDCVNAVGVDVNSASASLLTYISGLSSTLANNIVEYRNANGAFRSREKLKKVPRLGAKAFEQAAGFLRIMNGENPLDCSSVHPEAYPVVEKILKRNQRTLPQLIGDTTFLRSLSAREYTDETFGLPTVQDIIKELEKPGRDPRPDFKTATFKEGVEEMKDLAPGMILEGVITNVTNFGAFVDIGVHQDGLVHISQLADRFVKDPHTVVKAGDIVKVKVVEVDVPRKRISLTMKEL